MRKRPLLLTLGMIGSAIVAAGILLATIFALLGVGTYVIDGEEVTGREFLREYGAVFAIAAGLLLAISYTLAREKAISRELMIAFWLANGISGWLLSWRADRSFDLVWLFALAAAVWYLYFHREVVDWYAGLERPDRLPFDVES